MNLLGPFSLAEVSQCRVIILVHTDAHYVHMAHETRRHWISRPSSRLEVGRRLGLEIVTQMDGG